jgi:hypothetical protein
MSKSCEFDRSPALPSGQQGGPVPHTDLLSGCERSDNKPYCFGNCRGLRSANADGAAPIETC